MAKNRLDLRVEIEREADGRWIAEISKIPGLMVYGASKAEALAKLKVLAFQVITDRLEHGENLLTGLPLTDKKYIAKFAGLGFIPDTVAV